MHCKGVVKYLQQRYDLKTWQLRGASAGALVATLAACNVDTERAFAYAQQLAVDNRIFERRLGLAGARPCMRGPSPDVHLGSCCFRACACRTLGIARAASMHAE